MICPKCLKGEIQEQISIRGILLWKKKEVIFYCPVCNFESVKVFKMSKEDILIGGGERYNQPIEKVNKYISEKTIHTH